VSRSRSGALAATGVSLLVCGVLLIGPPWVVAYDEPIRFIHAQHGAWILGLSMLGGLACGISTAVRGTGRGWLALAAASYAIAAFLAFGDTRWPSHLDSQGVRSGVGGWVACGLCVLGALLSLVAMGGRRAPGGVAEEPPPA
jgi:hypothetical protein